MSTQFTIDLIRPGRGEWARWDWFLGVNGARHLAMVVVAGIALVAVIGVGGVLPRNLQYASQLNAVARLKREVVAADGERATLRESLRDLAAQARRQVRWSELLPGLSRAVPDSIRIERVALAKPAGPPQGAQPQPAKASGPASDLSLQIDATTTLLPGDARLLEIARFMAALAHDPAIAPRFQLRSWDLRSAQGTDRERQLHIKVDLEEKRS